MKYIILITSIFITLLSQAQVSDTIEVSFTKSAYLLFKSSNIKYDVGSEDVIVRSSDNKLIVQAEIEYFEETNLFVECDGEVFMFIINYVEQPIKYLYNYTQETVLKTTSPIKDNPKSDSQVLTLENPSKTKNENQIKEYSEVCEMILSKEPRILNMGVKDYKLNINLREILIHEEKIYLCFDMENRSNIPYMFDYYKFKVLPVKRRIKGESSQMIELFSLYEHNRPKQIEGNSKISYVVVLDKFVLTENKKLRIEHWEDNGSDMSIEGGRKINFDIPHRDILNVVQM